jgi:hypothetical protein
MMRLVHMRVARWQTVVCFIGSMSAEWAPVREGRDIECICTSEF